MVLFSTWGISTSVWQFVASKLQAEYTPSNETSATNTELDLDWYVWTTLLTQKRQYVRKKDTGKYIGPAIPSIRHQGYRFNRLC